MSGRIECARRSAGRARNGLGQRRERVAVLRGQAIATRQEGPADASVCRDSHGQRSCGPGERQPAGKVVGNFSVGGAQQNVGHSGAFRAGQPGRHKCIRCVQFAIDPQHATGQEHADDRDPVLLEALQEFQRMVRARLELQSFAVALELRVRGLAVDHHGDVRSGVVVAVGAQRRNSAGCRHLLPDTGEHRRAAREIAVPVVRALPVDGPATALHADVVGARAGDEDAGVRIEGQQLAIVFQEDHGLAHRLAGYGPVFGTADDRQVSRFRAVLGRLAGEDSGRRLDT